MYTEQITINNSSITIYHMSEKKYISIQEICKIFGLNYSSQLESIKEDSLLTSKTDIITLEENGECQHIFGLEYELLFGWIFQVDLESVKPNLKNDVLEFKKTCFKILSKMASNVFSIKES